MSIGVSTSTKPWRSMAPRMALFTVGPDAQVALHALAPEVEVAVPQADGLVDVVGPVVDRERRRLGRAEDLDRAVADLDLAGGQAGLTVPSGRGRTVPVIAHDVLAAQVVRRRRRRTARCPVRSRTSTKARCSPCSRRRATQPHTATSAGRRARRAARRTSGCACLASVAILTSLFTRSTTSPRATVSCSRRAARSRTHDGAVGRPPAPADDQRDRRARARRPPSSGDFMLRPSKARSAPRPARRSSSHERRWRGRRRRRRRRTRRRPVGGRGEHALGVAGQQRALDAEAEADARRRRAAQLLGEAVVAAAAADARSARRRGRRRRTRTWCGV